MSVIRKNRKKNRFEIRMSDEDIKMLDYIVYKTGKSKTDILRNGVRIQYNLEKYKE